MAKQAAIGVKLTIEKTRQKRRSKPTHLRGRKSLGPKSPDRGNRGRV